MTRSIDYRSYQMEGQPVTVIELSGQVDSTKDFESVEEVATRGDVEHVAVVMEAVEYINSRGCGGLISLHHKVENRGFHLYVVNPVGGVARVMNHPGRLCGFNRRRCNDHQDDRS